jgi:hypothetical protein
VREVGVWAVEFFEMGQMPEADSLQEALGQLTGELHAWCRSKGISKPRTSFTLSSVGRSQRSQYPELASSFKGMEVKTIILWLADHAQKYTSTEHCATRCTAMWSIRHFIQICDSGGAFLSEGEAAEAERWGVLYLQSVQWLMVHTDELGLNLWYLRPKSHYFLHLVTALRVTGLNPKRYSCEVDESFMHVMKKVGSKAHGASVMKRLLDRYILGLRMRFKRK